MLQCYILFFYCTNRVLVLAMREREREKDMSSLSASSFDVRHHSVAYAGQQRAREVSFFLILAKISTIAAHVTASVQN